MQIILSVTIEGIAICYFEIAINGILQYAEKVYWLSSPCKVALKFAVRKF